MSEINELFSLRAEDALALNGFLMDVLVCSQYDANTDPKKLIEVDLPEINQAPCERNGWKDVRIKYRLAVKELEALGRIKRHMSKVISDHRDLLQRELEALGENKWMQGDGILRIEPLVGDPEFRAFMATPLGTVYLGAYPTVAKAKDVWHERTKKAVDWQLRVFIWVDTPGGWKLGEYSELGDDELFADKFFQETRKDPDEKPFNLPGLTLR
jgi:hypothetical protein